MKAREYVPKIVMIISALLVMSCLLPGMPSSDART